MRALTLATGLLAFAAPLPALAQVSGTEVATAEIESTLKDPAMQAAVAEGMAAASEALLDLPLAPLAKAIAEAAGEDPNAVDPGMMWRSPSPGAEDAPRKVRESLPRMMSAMGSMAGGMGAMIPALREMAERMRAAMAAAGTRY
jgi:hypothetical protein